MIFYSDKFLKAIETRLKKELSSKLFIHSKAVSELAKTIAAGYKVNEGAVVVSGLLHDCAKGLSFEEMEKLLKNYHGKYFDKATKANSALWHNPCGVLIAMRKYGVTSPVILRAIALHSTGSAHMGMIDKIIYVSDYAEPNRDFQAAKKIRSLALTDIDSAVRLTVTSKIRYLKKMHKLVHPRSLALVKWINNSSSVSK